MARYPIDASPRLTDVLDLIPHGPLLARPDLAEQALEGLVRATVYRAVEPMHCRIPVADVRSDRDERISQLLFGEAFDVLECSSGRAWGRCRRDGVVGWMALDGLSAGVPLPVRRVASISAILPFNALVAATEAGISDAEMKPIGDFDADPAEVAERFAGVRHALGGRSSIETDCAGLVQLALQACGRAAPRYSDGQAYLGAAVSREQARRGDLAVWLHPQGGPGWTGHSALMLDDRRVIHASGFHGAVVIEDLDTAAARYAAEGFEAPQFRRL